MSNNQENIPTATVVNENINNPMTCNYNYNSLSDTRFIEIPPEDTKLQKCWRYGKTVKMLSFIDSCFCFMIGLYNPILFIVMLLPIFGYFGAKTYKFNYSFLYCFYNLGIISLRIVQLYYIYNNLYDQDSTMYDKSSKSILWISLIFQFWICWIVFKFTFYLHILKYEQLNALRIGTYLPVVTSIILT